MEQGKWISTKDRMPKEGDSIVVSFPHIGGRQYWFVENATYSMRGGKLYFAYYECDYWQPIDLIKD